MLYIDRTDLGALYPLCIGSINSGSRWDTKEAFRIFDTYLELGGNVFDTARCYSAFSKSEEFLGEWFQTEGKRNEIILISKGGHPDLWAKPVDGHKFRLSKEEMTEDLETSLKTMKTDHIDIYLYHRDDPKRPVAEVIETMESFVKQGKIRYYGCSNWTLERMKEAMEYCEAHGLRGFAMNQALYNAGTDASLPPHDDTLVKLSPEMRAYHKDHPELLAAAYSGVATGFFSQYAVGGEENVKDKAYLTPENIALAESFKKEAAEKGCTVLQLVLEFFKHQEMPCLPLFMPRDEASIKEAMAVFS